MKQGFEDTGVEVEEVHNLHAYASKMKRSLRFNALDTTENRQRAELKRDMKEVKDSVRQPGEHDKLFVAKRGEEVLGFLAVETKRDNGRKAAIRQLWTAHMGHQQRPIVGKLLYAAKHELANDGYPKLAVERINPSFDYSVVTANPEIGRYLRITQQEQEPIDIEVDDEDMGSLPEMQVPPSASELPDSAPTDIGETHQREASY